MTHIPFVMIIFLLLFLLTRQIKKTEKAQDTILRLDGYYVQQGDEIANLILQLETSYKIIDGMELEIADYKQDNHNYGLGENTQFCMTCGGEYTKELPCLCQIEIK